MILFLLSCGGSGQVKLDGLAPDAGIPSSDRAPLDLDQEFAFLQKAAGEDQASLALCGEMQARLYALYWQIFADDEGRFMARTNDLSQKDELIRESGLLEGEILDLADSCGTAYANLISAAGSTLTARLTEVPAIFKFLTKLVGVSGEAESQLQESFAKLSDGEKQEFFDSIVKSHAKYAEKTSLFGTTSAEFEGNLIAGKLTNEALAILKIANTGSVDPSEGFSKVFWDDAQENKKLPIDLSLKVGAELIRDGADVLVDVATGSGLGEFGKGVGHAKDVIEKVNEADSWLSQTWDSLSSLYESTVKTYFDGGKRSKELKYTIADYIDFEGNIAITESGAIQVKDYRQLEAKDLRAKMAFTNGGDVDSIILVHEFRDGRRSVQLITQTGGGTMPSFRYVPSSDVLSDNATTIITSKKDPVTGEIKYTSSSIRLAAGQTANVTLEVPEVSTVLPDTQGGGTNSGLTACQVTYTAINGQVCMDFSASGSNAASAAKQLCDGYSGVPTYSGATVKASCSGSAIKTCQGSLYNTSFYHSDSSQAQNISCDASGQWVWGS
jgi:hypothetical protein